MKALRLCGMLALIATIAACHQSTPTDSRDADIKAIRDTDEQLNRDYSSKDPDKILSHFADDAVLAVTGGSAYRGKDVIRTALKALITDPAYAVAIKASKIDVSKSGDLGYSEGTYILTSTDRVAHTVIHDHGTYLNVFRKEPDGTWKAEDLIATSELAPDR